MAQPASPHVRYGVFHVRGQHLLLNGEALRADAELDAPGSPGVPLHAAAAIAQPAPTGRAVRDQDRPDGRHVVPSVRKFLTYSVGIEAATPLSRITEIVP